MSHEPVLLRQCIELLAQGGAGVFVDGTLGAGGHAAALLEALPDSRLIGVDRDTDALALAAERLAPYGDRVFFCTVTSLPSAIGFPSTRPKDCGGSFSTSASVPCRSTAPNAASPTCARGLSI